MRACFCRRDFLKATGAGLMSVVLPLRDSFADGPRARDDKRVNIILVMADDVRGATGTRTCIHRTWIAWPGTA